MPKLDGLDKTDFLIQTWTQHLEHFLAISTVGGLGLSDEIVQQILLEVALSVYAASDKTSDKQSSTDASSQVGVELNFNDDGSLQAKTHHDLRKGILGKTLAIINYYMQSFIHGGMYPRQVLEDWQHDKTIDLKTQAASVKCFLNDNFDDVEYGALPDLLGVNKLLRISATQDDFASLDEAMAMSLAKFKTVFTLSIVGSINIFDKALLLKPTPKVSTAIELSAEQKDYIKDYIAIHGAEPSDYLLLISVHQRVARSIEQHLEKLCPHEFAILQLAQLAVSYFQALKAEYKMPDLVLVTRSEDYSPVFTLPPLPVCQTRSLKITITVGEIFKKIREFSGVKESLADYLMGKTLVLDGQVGEHVPEVLDKILSGDTIKLSRRNIDRFSKFFLGYIHETQGKLQQLILDVVQEIQINKLIDDVGFDATIADLLARKDIFRINELYELIENQAKIAEPTKEKETIVLWQKKWNDFIADAISKMHSLFASCGPGCIQLYYFVVIGAQEVELLDSSYHARFGDISRVSAKCVVTPMIMPDSTAYTDLSLATAIQEKLTGNPAQTLRLVLSDGKKYAACTVKVVPQIIAHEAACEFLQERFLPSDASKFLAKSDVVQIQHLCTTGAEIDTADLSLFLDKVDDEGFSALHHISIFCTSTGLLDSLLRLSPKLLQLKDTNGYTPFHCAVAAGNMIAVNYFITYLADKLSDVINLGTYAGYTPLMLACMHGKTEMAQILLAAGSDPNVLLPNGLYAAGLAILNKHIDAARVVLEYPATNVTLGSVNEESALHLALYNGQSNLACELMTRGARVYERTDFGLSIACSKGLHTVIPIIYSLLETKRQELLQSLHGERTRIEDALGNARRAERKSKGDPLGTILVVAANVVGAVCTGGSSMFMGGVGASLINFGSEVCRRGIGNTSGEIQASLDAINREIERVRSLALTHYPSGMGYTSAIHAAAENGDLDVVKKLVELEPSNSSATGGAYHKTALMMALEHGQEEVVKFLAGITSIGVVNHHGENSALCAAKVGQWEISDLLIARGDDPYLRDKTGMNYICVLIIKGDYARYSKLAARSDFSFDMHFTRNKNEYTSLELAWLHRHPLLANYICQQSKIKFEDKDLPAALQLAIAADDLDFILENKEKITEPDVFEANACLAAQSSSKRCLKEVFLPGIKTADASLILSALKSRSLEIIHAVLAKVEDINTVLDEEGNTAIHYAVKFGLSELIPVLLGIGAKLLSKNSKEYSPYHLAIENDNKEMLLKLLKLDIEDDFPDVLLSYAVQKRSKECIKVLIVNCKRLNLSKKYEKAQEVILQALTDVFYDLKILEQLLKFVPAERYQETLVMLLYFAIKHQEDEWLQFLLKLGADPLKVVAEDARQEMSDVPDTALAFAVSGNYINAITFFIEHGYAEQIQALAALTTNPYTRKIISGQSDDINDSIRLLLNGLAKRDVEAINTILTDFPLNTFRFNNPDKPIGPKAPFLHHLFTTSFVADESEDDYFKFIKAILMPLRDQINPLACDTDGNGLIFAIYYDSSTSIVRRQRSFKLIDEYFSDKKKEILTQQDKTGSLIIDHVNNDGVLELVSAGYPLVPPDGQPLLVRAVRKGYAGATQKILELGQSVDCCSPDGTTPLMVAAQKKHKFVEYLIKTWGANPNLRDYKGNTALYYAICEGDVTVALALLYYTDDVLVANTLGVTCLMKSLQGDDMPSVVKAIGYQMTDFSKRDRKGFGLMHYAADSDSTQDMRLLIEQGVDIDELSGRDLTHEDERTTVCSTAPVSHAASFGNARMFVDLVKQGARLDKLSSAVISPLEYVFLKKQEMWQMLRQFPQFYDKDIRTAWLIMAARDNVLPVLQELLLSGVPVSSYIENGNTALHLACERNSFEVAAMLLQLGASVDQANSDGNTPLHMAVSGNAVKLITLMAGVGVNPDLQNSLGETALYTACSSGHTSLVLALVKIGANMTLAAINGMTPAQIALHNGYEEVVTLLTIFGDNSIFEDATKLVTLKVDYSGRAAGLIEKLNKTNLEATAEERTPLHKAVMLDNKNAIITICDLSPALLLIEDKNGLTPEQLAVSLGKKEIALLLRYCAKRRLEIMPVAVTPIDVKPMETGELTNQQWRVDIDTRYATSIVSLHPAIKKWFSSYFESIVIVSLDQEKLAAICAKWDRFVRLLSKSCFTLNLDRLSAPPKQRISFQLDSYYLERACLVLDKLDDPIVLRYLDQLPDLRQLQQALLDGFTLVTKSMLAGDSFKKYTREQIQSSADYFVIRAQIYASIHPLDYDATADFFKILDKNEILTKQQKIILAKCYAKISIVREERTDSRVDSSLLNHFVLSAEKISQKLGDRQYLAIFASDSRIVTLIDYIELCDKALGLGCTVKSLRAEDFDLLKTRFLTTSEYVSYPLAESELDNLLIDYKYIVAQCAAMQEWDTGKISHLISELARDLKAHPTASKSVINKLLACLRLQILYHFGIYPHDTQMLVLLGLINYPTTYKGRIGQVRTGEGKSTIVAMLAAFLAMRGYFVDVITSSRNLAERDQKKYAKFFKSMLITSSHIALDHPTSDDFNGQIIFGTNYDFEAALLQEVGYEDKARIQNGKSRPSDVVIVDEIDNVFIDKAIGSTRLLIESPKDYTWVYAPIYECISTRPADEEYLLIGGQKQQIVNKMRELLNSYQSGRHGIEMLEISDEQLWDWRCAAIEAADWHQENIDYTVVVGSEKGEVKREITIMDYDTTGRQFTKARWGRGLHEFLEVKHQIPPKNESICFSAMAHPPFFSEYKAIFGLTGTCGKDVEREEVKAIYQVDIFDVPPHRKPIRERYHSSYYIDRKLYNQKIITSVQTMTAAGRPVLIICKTIRDSQYWSELMQKNTIKHLVLNTIQSESEDYILEKAGGAAAVTIATNTAGRGTDIILTPTSQANGGLHVIMMFLPDNERVEEQGIGRAGRQGQPGSCELILHMSDSFIRQLIRSADDRVALIDVPNKVTRLIELRSKSVIERSLVRIKHTEMELILHNLFKDFSEKYLPRIRSGIRALDTKASLAILDKFSRAEYSHVDQDIAKNILLQGLIKQAYGLLVGKNKGLTVNWSMFVRSCKEKYIRYLMQQWAVCYKEINDYREKMLKTDEPSNSLGDSTKFMQDCYSKFLREKIAPMLDNPELGLRQFMLYIFCASWDVYIQQLEKEEQLQAILAEKDRLLAEYLSKQKEDSEMPDVPMPTMVSKVVTFSADSRQAEDSSKVSAVRLR